MEINKFFSMIPKQYQIKLSFKGYSFQIWNETGEVALIKFEMRYDNGEYIVNEDHSTQYAFHKEEYNQDASELFTTIRANILRDRENKILINK